MRQNKVEGTKIAQAAKDLNVTSQTIRRYLSEFDIESATDENGVKVLPPQAMDELNEVRRLKEDGLTNPKVLEFLEERRKGSSATKEKPKGRGAAKRVQKDKEAAEEAEAEEIAEEVEEAPPERKTRRQPVAEPVAAEVQVEGGSESDGDSESEGDQVAGPVGGEGQAEGRSKHTLTCQTCSKTFEHMNPRLRDCLDCYRAKRKERRRGGADRHKNVIQNPLAAQAASRAQNLQSQNAGAPNQGEHQAPAAAASGGQPQRQAAYPPREPREPREFREPREAREAFEAPPPPPPTPYQIPAASKHHGPGQKAPVRNYRKAIEETRLITGSLKRRLERPDLPEGERRWLEQIYAYQLILHQGWRHLAEYKSNSQPHSSSGSSSSSNSSSKPQQAQED